MPSALKNNAESVSHSMNVNVIQNAIDSVSKRYGKVWPLHTVNACNPLVGFEELDFVEALKLSKTLLNHRIEDSLPLFRALFNKGKFIWDDVVKAVDQYPSVNTQTGQTLSIDNKTVTYKELLLEELHSFLTEDVSIDSTILQTAKSLSRQHTKVDTRVLSLAQSSWVDEQLVKYLAAYWDNGQAVWKMPRSYQESFFQAWLGFMGYDGQLSKAMQSAMKQTVTSLGLNALPPLQRIESLLQQLSVSDNYYEAVLHELCQSLPGWVGYLKYQQDAEPNESSALFDYIAVRLLYTIAVIKSGFNPTTNLLIPKVNSTFAKRLGCFSQHNSDFIHSFKESPEQWRHYFDTISELDCVAILIRALENHHHAPLLQSLTSEKVQKQSNAQQYSPKAQAVFCIDVRSEPYRRILEAVSSVETYGFAGFFGLAIEGKNYGDVEALPLCPILLSPSYSVEQSVADLSQRSLISPFIRKVFLYRQQWIYALKKIKRDLFATFGYVEALGFIHGFTMIRDSFAASLFGVLFQKIKEALQANMGLTYTIQPCSHHSAQMSAPTMDLSVEEKAGLLASIIPLMSLRFPLAPFVIIAGHIAQAKNNPYKSSLDCGACGANGGGYNASVICQWLNDKSVRSILRQSFDIPETTYFIAAEHNTTTQEVVFLNESVIQPLDFPAWQEIRAGFRQASDLCWSQSISKLSSLNQQSHLSKNTLSAYDWSQTRPEWGLSQNHAFIIGQRAWTQKLNLDGRCFLHTYDWTKDEDESVLSLIMAAPMVVGAWINLQYLFSTLDQERFGSGKKYTHNIVGLLGAYQGNRSDLQVGLPYESLFSNDGTPYHIPQRLLVCIEAPKERVQRIINKTPSVKQLVENGWIRLAVFDPLD